MEVIKSFPASFSTTQKVVAVSMLAGIGLLSVLASYLGRRKVKRVPRRTRRIGTGGRRTRNSVRSPNDIISLAGSKTSARSLSPGGSMQALSDRMSLASGSLASGAIVAAGSPMTAQQLGVMGMEALETVIGYWEDALVAHSNQHSLVAMTKEEENFCAELQNLLDAAYNLQDQSELLFLDERSVLFREDEVHTEISSLKSAAKLTRPPSDPNFDSAESFASALDQVADLREFEDFIDAFPELERYPLYQAALKHMEEQPIPYRKVRTEMVSCTSDAEYLAKLHCLRLAFQYLFKDETVRKWVEDNGRQILTDLLCLGDKDPKDFLVAYESMVQFLQDGDNWPDIERELELRNVKAMTFYDVCLDFIVLDAFRDLDNPPASVLAVVQNRFLTNGFKETALTTAVWSVLKAKRRLLKYPNGFMAHFYIISEYISPLMAWGFFGPDENLKDLCHYFRNEMMTFLTDIYSFQKVRYTTVEELAADIHKLMRERIKNVEVRFSQ